MAAKVRLENFADPSDVLIFPITPAELPETADATVKSFNVIGKGGHSFPDGRSEYKFTLAGYFPGQGRYSPENLYQGNYAIQGHLVHEMVYNPQQHEIVGRGDNLPHIHDWRHPEELVFQLREWLKNKAKLRYVADSMAGLLQVPVFLHNYSFTKRGWAGDIAYSLSFTEWRTLSVFIDDGSASAAGSTSASTSSDSSASEDGNDEDANPTSYTVQEGDNLTFIAKRFLGDGGRWPEIYDLNRDTIGDNPNMLEPGMELLIPGGTVAEPNQDGYAPMGAESVQAALGAVLGQLAQGSGGGG